MKFPRLKSTTKKREKFGVAAREPRLEGNDRVADVWRENRYVSELFALLLKFLKLQSFYRCWLNLLIERIRSKVWSSITGRRTSVSLQDAVSFAVSRVGELIAVAAASEEDKVVAITELSVVSEHGFRWMFSASVTSVRFKVANVGWVGKDG